MWDYVSEPQPALDERETFAFARQVDSVDARRLLRSTDVADRFGHARVIVVEFLERRDRQHSEEMTDILRRRCLFVHVGDFGAEIGARQHGAEQADAERQRIAFGAAHRQDETLQRLEQQLEMVAAYPLTPAN